MLFRSRSSTGAPVDDLYREARVWKSANLAELSARVAGLPLAYAPGEAWAYSIGMDIQGAIIERLSGRPLPVDNLHIQAVAGLDGIKEASLPLTDLLPDWKFLEGQTLKVAVAHGLGNAAKLLDAIAAGKASYHFVEIMTCPGGCIGGGGQPRFTDDAVRLSRIKAIYEEDEGKTLRKSHENPDIKKIYDDFLKEPLGEKSHHLLHTKYTRREKV